MLEITGESVTSFASKVEIPGRKGKATVFTYSFCYFSSFWMFQDSLFQPFCPFTLAFLRQSLLSFICECLHSQRPRADSYFLPTLEKMVSNFSLDCRVSVEKHLAAPSSLRAEFSFVPVLGLGCILLWLSFGLWCLKHTQLVGSVSCFCCQIWEIVFLPFFEYLLFWAYFFPSLWKLWWRGC